MLKLEHSPYPHTPFQGYNFPMLPLAKENQPGKKKALPYVLGFISAFLVFALGAFFQETIAVFNFEKDAWMNDVEYFLTLAIVLIASIGFLLIAHRYFKTRVNFVFLSLALVLFASNIVALVLFPNESVVEVRNYDWEVVREVIYSLNNMERARYAISFGMTLFCLYLMLAVFPQILHDSRQLRPIYYAIVVIAYFLIIWSLIFERDIYSSYFDPSSDSSNWGVVKSLTNNRNTFGTALLFSLCALCLLEDISPHWWHFLIGLPIFLMEFIVLSKTTLILSLALIIAFGLYLFVKHIRGRPIKTLIFGALFVAVAVLFLFALYSPMLDSNLFLSRVRDHFLNVMNDSKQETLESRVDIWNLCISHLNSPWRLFFGLGDMNSQKFLGPAIQNGRMELGFSHNGFVLQIHSGGLIRLVAYIALLAWFIGIGIFGIAKKKPGAPVLLLVLGILLGHGMTETTSFLQGDLKGLVGAFLVGIPLATNFYHRKEKPVFVAIPQKEKVRYLSSPRNLAGWLLFFLTPIVGIFVLLYPSLNLLLWERNLSFHNGWFYGVLISVYFFLPIIYFQLGFLRKKTRRFWIAFATILAIAGITLSFLRMEKIAFFVTLFGLLIIAFASFLRTFSLRKGRNSSAFFPIFLPHYLCGGAAIITGLILGNSGNSSWITPYSLLAIGVLFLTLYIVVVFASPLNKALLFPFSERWARWEAIHYQKITNRFAKIDARLAYLTSPRRKEERRNARLVKAK